jgi:hypothetical protein
MSFEVTRWIRQRVSRRGRNCIYSSVKKLQRRVYLRAFSVFLTDNSNENHLELWTYVRIWTNEALCIPMSGCHRGIQVLTSLKSPCPFWIYSSFQNKNLSSGDWSPVLKMVLRATINVMYTIIPDLRRLVLGRYAPKSFPPRRSTVKQVPKFVSTMLKTP